MEAHKKRVLFWVVGVLALGALVWGVAVFRRNWLARARLAACLSNMAQIDAAAESYCLENKLSYDTMIRPEWVAEYLKNSRAPLCPLGKKPYPPFTAQQGSRCPNSEQHSQASTAPVCRNAMSSLWDAAIAYAAVAKLSWNATIDPTAAGLLRYRRGAIWGCPLGTNPYAPFTLAHGPVCPNSPAHNPARGPHWGPNQDLFNADSGERGGMGVAWPKWLNRHMFNADGSANTDLPLSRANTNLF